MDDFGLLRTPDRAYSGSPHRMAGYHAVDQSTHESRVRLGLCAEDGQTVKLAAIGIAS